MVEQFKLIKESSVKIEIRSDDKLIIEKAEPSALTAADSKFLTAADDTNLDYNAVYRSIRNHLR